MTNAGVIRVYSEDRTLLAELAVTRSGIQFEATGVTIADGRFEWAEWHTPAGDIVEPPYVGPGEFVVGAEVTWPFEAWGPVVERLATARL